MNASVFIGTSLDGFIARLDGDFDFLPAGGGEPHGYVEFMATVDVMVIGRKTFETVLGFGGWPYGKMPVVVLSTRPLAAVPAGARVERMSGDPAVIVSKLSARGMQHAYVDGGITIQRFLEAGLIQRLVITRVPVLIGTGIPLFGPLRGDVVLTHVATRQFKSGLVQSEYAIVTKPTARVRATSAAATRKASPATRPAPVPSSESPAKQLSDFIAKYDPAVARLVRATRAALRKRLPTAIELVYDNYQFLAIGFSATERASDCLVSLAVSPKGVSLSFYYGASLPDPTGILLGSGTQNRFVRLDGPATLATPAVEALLRAAMAQAETPLPATGRGYTVIKSVSAKQRPRRAIQKTSTALK